MATSSTHDDLTKLHTKLEQLLLSHANLSNTLHDLANHTSILETQSHSPSPSRPLKFDLPNFNGSDALGWIFKVTQFFYYHQTPIAQRTHISSFYLEGPALAWFQWMSNNNLLTSWDTFLRALELRFASSTFDDPIASLCKLTQTTTLHDYLFEFETLANRISHYPQSFYLSFFLSSLKPHLRREVTALQPPDLPHAIALAKLHNDKFSSPPPPSNRFGRTLPSLSPPINSATTALKPLPHFLPTPLTKLPINISLKHRCRLDERRISILIVMNVIREGTIVNHNSYFSLLLTQKVLMRTYLQRTSRPLKKHIKKQVSLVSTPSRVNGPHRPFGLQGPLEAMQSRSWSIARQPTISFNIEWPSFFTYLLSPYPAYYV